MPSLAGKGAWEGWRPLRISSSTDESDHVKSFCLEALDEVSLPSVVPGQFLPICFPSGLVRCSSVSSLTFSRTPSIWIRVVRNGSALNFSRIAVINHAEGFLKPITLYTQLP